MDALLAISKRRSIRKYLQKPVEFDKITAILEAGHFAPSAGNLQDWKFIVITDKEKRRAIAEHCIEQYWMASAPLMIVVCSDIKRAELEYGLRGKRLYTVQDAAAATQNMLLSAYSLGLGSCWVGAFDEEFLASLLSIPESSRPQAIITLGYPDETPIGRDEASLRSRVYFNEYGTVVKNFHRVLKDYSVEWEKHAKELQPVAQSGVDMLKQGVQKLKERVKR